MSKKTNPRRGVPLAVPAPRVALAAGPEHMNFCGRSWRRGLPQSITPELWATMQARGASRLGFILTEEI